MPLPLHFPKALALILLTFAALAQTACTTEISNADIEPISLAQVRELQAAVAAGKPKAILLIDARSARAYAQGAIPGAINLNIAGVSESETTRDKRLDAYKVLAVYGDDPGSPAAQALTKRLLFVGYGGVRMYMDGYNGWRRAGLPTFTPSKAAPLRP